jgi:general secretion pathway protein F/type IV pilus assembly protein PilC
MPLYQYKALMNSEKKFSGVIDAEHLEEAKWKIKEKNLFLLEIKPVSIKRKQSISLGDISLFTHSLSRLLEAGLPLYEALQALQEKFLNPSFQNIIFDLCEQIKMGKTFSEALNRHEKVFDMLTRSMIHNAEKSGTLASALEEISSLIQKQIQIKKQLVGALLYPSLLFGFSLLIIGVLLFFIIPSLRELFEGRELNGLTTLIVNLSHFLSTHKTLVFSSFSFIALSTVILLLTSKGKKIIHSLFYRITFFKQLIIKMATIRFLRALSSLLQGGISYLPALKLSIQVMKCPQLEKPLQKAALKIAEGKKLSELLKNEKDIPPLVPRMLAVAEQSGEMVKMLHYLAKIYEEEYEKTLAQITTLLQPIMLIVLGLIVGMVVLSILIPLTDVSSFIAD